MPQQIQLLFPQKLSAPLDYLWDNSTPLVLGQVVMAPLRRKCQVGLVVGRQAHAVSFELRNIDHAIALPPFPEKFVRFLLWMSAYTMTPPGTVIKMTFAGGMPAPIISPRTRIQWAPWAMPDKTSGYANAPLLREVIENQGVESVNHLILSGMIFPGGKKTGPSTLTLPRFSPGHIKTLNKEQQYAADMLREAVMQKRFQPFLLDGITGSGKTEVYFEGLHAVLETGGQGLVLLPEITLTHEWLQRFEKTFGIAPLVWHSGITAPQKRLIWHRLMRNEPLILVGARSALFLPFHNLKLIVVDEEHDQSYKQEEGGSLYNGRDMAVARSAHEGIPVLLASATPSLESLENTETGKYTLLRLTKRALGAALPSITLIDMRQVTKEPLNWISPQLIDVLKTNHADGNLSLLFLNRRGYAPLVLCRTCGHQYTCPHCSVWLAQHQKMNRLLCHHCGHNTPIPEACLSCGSVEALSPCGPGVERIGEEIAAKLPDMRVEVVTSDQPGGMAALLDSINRKEIDLLIGTQLLAKGHNFHDLTVVGIVDGDMGLIGGDPRAQEKSFQLLHQLSGRAGRGQKSGAVYIQTYNPGNPLMTALKAHDRAGLMAYEKQARQLVSMPPFGVLAAVIIAARDPEQAEKAAAALRKHCPDLKKFGANIQVLGPVQAPLYKKRDFYRWRFLVKGEKHDKLQPLLKQWIDLFQFPKHIQITIDIDPQTFM